MYSWNPGGNRRWQERQPQPFPLDQRLRPIRVFLPDTLFCEFTCEVTHLKCKQNPLFSRHPSQNLKLDFFGGRTRVLVDHGAVLARAELIIGSTTNLNLCGNYHLSVCLTKHESHALQ